MMTLWWRKVPHKSVLVERDLQTIVVQDAHRLNAKGFSHDVHLSVVEPGPLFLADVLFMLNSPAPGGLHHPLRHAARKRLAAEVDQGVTIGMNDVVLNRRMLVAVDANPPVAGSEKDAHAYSVGNITPYRSVPKMLEYAGSTRMQNSPAKRTLIHTSIGLRRT